MDANRAEMELENTRLRSQINTFQSELESIRKKVEKLTEENESLRRELRRSVDDRLSGFHPDTLSSINNNSVIDYQRQQLQLLEDEKENAMNLYEQSRQAILELEQEIEDLKNPLKPHLLKLDMQTKQVQEEHARAEAELIQEINMMREELGKRSRELVNCQLRVKELERANETLQIEVNHKQDELRNYTRKEIGYDGNLVAFQNSMDELEVRLEQAVKEKEKAIQERDEIERKFKDLTRHHQDIQEQFSEMADRTLHHAHIQPIIHQPHVGDRDRLEHDQIHRTIDDLIDQAAVKTRTAIEEVRQQYNDNLERIMQEYNKMEEELNKKQVELDKCLRAKRNVEEELEKILHERKLNLEKSAIESEDLGKRCFRAERERDEIQIKYEQTQQAYNMLQQSFSAEKSKHEHREKELNERLQKVTIDLDKMTANYTILSNELNELKKKLSLNQNEQTLLQRRMTESIKRHDEELIEKEKDCLARLAERDSVNRTTFNELRNLVSRQQRMIVKYKEECHTIASQSETKIQELKQKIENIRGRNEKLQSEIADLKRKETEMDRIVAKNANRIKTLEERLHDAEEQAVEASRRVAKQLVRDRLALVQSEHYPVIRPNHSTSLLNLPSYMPIVTSSNPTNEHFSDDK